MNAYRILVHALLSLVLIAAYPTAAAEKKLTLKVGTLAPTGTSYHKQLMLLKEKWQKASSGSIQLIVYPDGRQGTEPEMVSAMATGNLHAGLLTATGLSMIEPAVTALQSMPMAFRTLDEVDYVAEKMRPMLEDRLTAKGFVVLFWSDSGWVRFFSKHRVVHPDDLRKLKVFSWAGGKGEFEAWKQGRFNPVSLEPGEIFSSLGTGIITSAPMPPFFALATQIDTVAPHMLELNWAPLVGALVVRRESWEKVPADLRAEFLKDSADTGREIKARARAEGLESVVAMQKRKLTVSSVDAGVQSEWERAAEEIRERVRGPIVPSDLYDAVQAHLKEFRSRGASN